LQLLFYFGIFYFCAVVYSVAGITPVTFSDWQKIDAVEKSRGESRGKPREKIVDVDVMLSIAHS